MVEAYPLQWPPAWPRTPEHKRERARFSQKTWKDKYSKPVTFEVATNHLYNELEKLGTKGVVLSSNLQLRLDGVPYANQRKPEDPGIAVYFNLNSKEQCIPCDKWDRAEDNIRAVAKTIEALRGLERWGAKEMVNAAFRGFKALPSPDEVTPMHAWYFEGYRTKDEAKSRYRELAKKMHADVGGDLTEFNEMKRQYEQLP
jgi:hypothetical protein